MKKREFIFKMALFFSVKLLFALRNWRRVVDGRRTLYHQEIRLLVKMTIRKGRRVFIYLDPAVPTFGSYPIR